MTVVEGVSRSEKIALVVILPYSVIAPFRTSSGLSEVAVLRLSHWQHRVSLVVSNNANNINGFQLGQYCTTASP